jgi:hypothetical protein
MSTDPTGAAGGPAGPGGAPGQPSEEELRAAYEAELSRISSADMMLQAAVSLLNIGSFKLAPRQPAAAAAGQPPPPADVSDLEQVRDAIDGVRALLEILERRVPGGELKPLRDALSQLQMAYAREAQASGVPAGAGAESAPSERPQQPPAAGEGGQQGQGEAPQGEDPSGPGPAESSGRLWVPGR